MFDSTLTPTGADLSPDRDFGVCLSLSANSGGTPSRSVLSNRASPASKRLYFCGLTRDVAEVNFAIPVGFSGFVSDVDLIAANFSSAEIFLSLHCYLHMFWCLHGPLANTRRLNIEALFPSCPFPRPFPRPFPWDGGSIPLKIQAF
jgi:hypothetical protein